MLEQSLTNSSRNSRTARASAQLLRLRQGMRKVLPTRTIGILMAVGIIDLLTTALLHANGQIVELNPLMKFFIDRSEWLFAAVKGLSLVAAWVALAWYARYNKRFVDLACIGGTVAYLAIWCTWFFSAR